MKPTSLEPRRNRSPAPWRASPFGSFFPTPFTRDFNELFNDSWSALSPFWSEGNRDLGPACDVSETETSYEVCVDVPGLRKDDIDIEVLGNRLTVSGERKEEREEGKKGERSYFSERRFGRFERSFTLPDGIEASQVSASYNNGVLDISIPKGKESQRSKISISDGRSSRSLDAGASRGGKEGERH